MNSRLGKLLLALLFFWTLLPARLALADTGPKPTMEFEFKPELTGEAVTIISGVLVECEQPDCSDASPLEELGPQRFTCEANNCHAMAYGFSPYHRLEIQFSDARMRQSNIFETAGFDSKYTVTVRPDDLLVDAQFNVSPSPYTTGLLVICVFALAGISLLIGLIVFLVRRSKKI